MNLKLTRPLAFFDIESTGTSVSKDRIVELAILKLFPDGLRETRVYRFNPEMPIAEEAVKIHGISNEDVKDAPVFADKAAEILEYLDHCDLAGYNSNRFDVPMLIEEFARSGLKFDIDDRKLIDAYQIFIQKERRDLSAAYRFYCDKELINAHSAEADITATFEVLESQLERYGDLERTPEALDRFCKQEDFVDLGRRMILKEGEVIFNFGKHKGRKVVDVLRREPQYYDWIMNADFMSDTKQKLKEIKKKMS